VIEMENNRVVAMAIMCLIADHQEVARGAVARPVLGTGLDGLFGTPVQPAPAFRTS